MQANLDLCRWFKCQRTIAKPETFYKYVHEPLGVKNIPIPKSLDDIDPEAEGKTKHFLDVLKKMQEFLHAYEDRTGFDTEKISAIKNDVDQAPSYEIALKVLSPHLNKVIIEGEDYPNGERPDKFSSVLSGGMHNMLATVLGLAKLVPELLMKQVKFKDSAEFAAKVKEVTRNNVSLLLGFSKLSLGILFRMLNILGPNHREHLFNYYYEFNPKFFTLDDSKNPSKVLPLRSLAIRLVKAIKKHPYAMKFGQEGKIDLRLPAYGCPAVYVRTQDGKQNMVEYFSDLICDVLDKTVFTRLDKWFKLPAAA